MVVSDEPRRDPLQTVGLVLLAMGAGCYAAFLIALIVRRRAWVSFRGSDNKKGPMTWVLAAGGLLTFAGMFCLIAVSIDDRCSDPKVDCYF
jgi:hypothetical protein